MKRRRSVRRRRGCAKTKGETREEVAELMTVPMDACD